MYKFSKVAVVVCLFVLFVGAWFGFRSVHADAEINVKEKKRKERKNFFQI